MADSNGGGEDDHVVMMMMTRCIETLSITSSSSTTMEDLSVDLIDNIFFRLPFKYLLRFKSVSKNWYSLISPDSEFAIRHLKQSISSTPSKSVFFELDPSGKSILFHYSDDHDHTLEFDFPKEILKPCRVFGSANGLICVAPLCGKGCFLWNPLIGECKIISRTENFSTCWLSGFCYDSVSDDYKIVCVWSTRFAVFSLKKNSWTTEREHSISFRGFTTTPMFSNGSIHWCMAKKIVAFDSEKDHLFTMKVPIKKWPYTSSSKLKLFDYQGSLCFYDNIILWEMKEYGVEDSWTELDTESVNLPAWISRLMQRKSKIVKLVGFLHTESLISP